MTVRVGSALDFLAAAVAALAVFALPLLLWHTTASGPFHILLGFAVAAVAVVWLVHGPNWPGRLAALIGVGVVTFVCGVATFFFGLWIMDKGSLCGFTWGWFEVGLYGAAVIYAAVAGWALKGRVGVRFFSGPPAGAVLGIAWVLAVLALTQHGASSCDLNFSGE